MRGVKISAFLVLALAAAPLSIAAERESEVEPEKRNSSIGYPSVADARQALGEKEGVDIRIEGGWTIATDRPENTIWSFTPENHSAHPAVVKREIVNIDGALRIQMSVLCQAEKVPCDKLVDEFKALNNRLAEQFK